MQADIILGINTDTQKLIDELKEMLAENIIVLDYELLGDMYVLQDIIYISPNDLRAYLKSYKIINYYKSIYFYPGMFKKID